MKQFECLLKPIQVGPMRLANRMVRAPMHCNLAGIHGEVTEPLIDMYSTCAANGIGMIVVESTEVDGRHAKPAVLRMDDDRFKPGMRRLVESIHDNGVPVAVQLRHAGLWGNDPVSPSGLPCWGFAHQVHIQPRILSLTEIEEVRDLFIGAAVRARSVGFDGILLHGITSFLLQQFVSPRSNQRTDRYGGSLENRCALSLEIVRGIRQQCESSFAIGYAMVVDELLPDGTTVEESSAFARMLEQEGVHWIDARIGSYETILKDPKGGAVCAQENGFLNLSETLKRNVSKTIVFDVSRGQHDPLRWEEAIANGKCQVVELGRPLLADPALPNKLKTGALEDVRLCIKCGYCNERVTGRNWQVGCAINPDLCRERGLPVRQVPRPKRILVIGGGPAGLEAARVAALRGHEVTLMEKEAMLGGNLRVSSYAPRKDIYQSHMGDWLERQCRKAKVKIELDREVTAEVVAQFQPDAVIMASGARPVIPAIPGIDRKQVITAADLLTGKATVGKQVVVAGGGEVGLEAADFIAAQGTAEAITIVEMLPDVGANMYGAVKSYLVGEVLYRAGVRIVTGMRIEEIAADAVTARDGQGEKHAFAADTVVLAFGYTPAGELYESLLGTVPELYPIGDCVQARQIPEAIREASCLAGRI
jgi:2,4-dienoyl-CoA reductase-like NADH-dependent reductase (Old Yellow Enzyme family)/NADPH-dependent 2,4-dienoyl-CoA reductase/sulfur reductase-like enzyme